jgi:hypothetical protein
VEVVLLFLLHVLLLLLRTGKDHDQGDIQTEVPAMDQPGMFNH